MKNKIRILVTHQIHYLTEANKIILLDDGKVKAQGSYTEIVNAGIDMNQMFSEIEEQNDVKRQNSMKDKLSESSLNDFTLVSRLSIGNESKFGEDELETEAMLDRRASRAIDLVSSDAYGSVRLLVF